MLIWPKVSLSQGELAVAQGHLRHHFFAMQEHQGHAAMPLVMCFGIVSIPQRLLIGSCLMLCCSKALISSHKKCMQAFGFYQESTSIF